MDRIIRTVLSVRDSKPKNDDDFVDRLSRQYTISLLIFFSFIVTTKTYVGDPISCWCPAHFTESHRRYANEICWVSNTYYLPFEEEIPPDFKVLREERKMVSYYQWVPLILLCQATIAFVPCLFWRFMNSRSGIDVTAIMEAATVCHKASYSEIREKTVRYIVNQIDRYLLTQREHKHGCFVRIKETLSKYCFVIGGKRQGNYLTVTYLMIKLLYTANAVGQLFLLDMILDIEFHLYGVYVVNKLFRGEDWTVSERFPRVTLCNFKIRHQNRLHEYIVQCALAINLFNEKIFIILWFWYVFVAIMTFINLLQWIGRSLYWPGQVHFVKRKIRAFEASHRTKATVSKFAQYYLRRDGIFIIRLMSLNVGELVAAECLSGLWENYGPDRRAISEHPSRRRTTGGSGTYQTVERNMEVV